MPIYVMVKDSDKTSRNIFNRANTAFKKNVLKEFN